ncbi:MAG: bifunctional 2-C-methyl-D-erythritol 4-phosphate cytidylyltransferase/2-C-methyl-D-erythritol 2,4-cyclodiphosphate synthase [Fulvimarina manganoxydans]|nr:bifunctional 2-C-methyl-D-erythritol 4-phosphate cytidylyltransferase/2-C-methyl-D-erythritol 2,4-cyclodiphosphate synthase [Fulvimarina manganoxydans]
MFQRVAALVVAGGRGERAGPHADGPKQFRRIGGVAVLLRTLRLFAAHPRISDLILVGHAEDRERIFDLLAGTDLSERVDLVDGGPSRQASVANGLQAMERRAPDAVLIHDAVRPFVDAALIDRVIAAIEPSAGALPVVAVADTLKAGQDGIVVRTVDRAGLYAAQTPQGFPFSPILEAHLTAARSGSEAFTDDASIAEWAGLPVRLVEGDPINVKLTTARDIALADRQLSQSKEAQLPIDVRTGNGYDVHRLVEGDHVTLCGVRIPHDQSLSGHSDADVGFHALTDALLATCGAGDIGDHFPPSDPQWRGAASHIFLSHAKAVVEAKGGRIMNADVSLICEAPKIAPHREAMCAEIGRLLGLERDRVSVKATTNETIGFVGRREGIAAIATASVAFGENR